MKVVLLGDSITQGLGSKKINFVGELEYKLSSEDILVNLALTGTTIDYVESIFEVIKELKPDYAVILYGNVDAMIKPNRQGKIFSRLPKRFRGPNGAMLLPRPFYSHKWYKNIGQHIENRIRTFFRKLIIAIDGTEQWIPLEQYKEHFTNVCTRLKEAQITPIICSTVYIDDRLFNGSDAEYKKYNGWMRRYAEKEGIRYIDLYTKFREMVHHEGWKKYYNFDHFHPNGEGYLVMATEIANALQN